MNRRGAVRHLEGPGPLGGEVPQMKGLGRILYDRCRARRRVGRPAGPDVAHARRLELGFDA